MAFQGTDRFEVLGVLGSGGMGMVYEAYDHVQGMRVALKTLRQVSATRLLRFKREFRTLRQLVHPNIVTLYELVADGDALFFTMELVDGTDLLSYVRAARSTEPRADTTIAAAAETRHAGTWVDDATVADPSADSRTDDMPLDPGQGAPAQEGPGRTGTTRPGNPPPAAAQDDGGWSLGLLNAMAGAMDDGMDEPTADLSIWFEGEAVPASRIPTCEQVELDALVDMVRLRDVLAQLVSALKALHGHGLVHRDLKPSNVMVTREGRVVLMDFGLVAEMARPRMLTIAGALPGTPSYMAPEQIRGQEPTAATDWYAFGSMLYLLLTDRLPYEGRVREQMMWAKLNFDPAPPSTFTRGIPETLDALCMRLLARTPDQRPDGNQVLTTLGLRSANAVLTRGMQAVDVTGRELFVGRARELEILRDAYATVRAGHMRCVVVEGLSGMGKSSLVEHFTGQVVRSAPPDEMPLVLAGRCNQRENLPYKAFDAVFDQLSHQLLQVPSTHRGALLPAGMPLLARLFPVLRRVPEAEGRVTLAGMSPEQLRQQAVRALHALLVNLARQQSVIVRIDDLQWADRSSLELLQDLLQGPPIPGLLWLVTIRAEPVDTADQTAAGFLATLGELRHIYLEPLSEDEQRELLVRMTRSGHSGGDPDDRRDVSADAPADAGPGAAPGAVIGPQLAHRLRYEAAGHPMLLVELVRHALEALTTDVAATDAVITDAEDPLVDTLGATVEDVAPGTRLRLEDVIWHRAARLPEPARVLLDVVALTGEPAPLRVLAQAAALPPAERERALMVLDQARLVRLIRTADGLWLDVYHDKVRAAMVARLAEGPARRLHGHLARAMETWPAAPVVLRARHWLAAGEREQAVRYLMQAAAAAAEQLAYQSAADLYGAVAELLARDATDPRLGPWLCRAWIGLAEGMRIMDRGREAMEQLDRAQAVAGALGLVAELADIHTLRGNLLFPRGDLEGCLREHERARVLARQAGSPRREARVLSGLGDALYMRGRMISAYEHYDHCIALCETHALVDVEAANLSMRGLSRFYQNDFDAALRDGARAVALAARVGHARAEINARCNCLSLVWAERGRVDRARRELETAHALARELGARRFEATSLLFLARLLAMQGRLAEARQPIERSLALCRETGLSYVGPIALGTLALVTDSAAVRAQAMAEAENILRAGAASHNHLYFHRDAMDIALAAGDHDALERHAHALAHYTRAEPLPWSDFFIARARALSAHRRGVRDASLRAALARLHDQARRVGFHMAAGAIEQALQE